MSNHFSCNFSGEGDFYQQNWQILPGFLGKQNVEVHGYYFFYCAQPNATSASIQNVTTNLREYYVSRLKIDFCTEASLNADSPCYMMVFVLNVPQDYAPSKAATYFKLSDLPSHTISESVLYYDLVILDNLHTTDISIDIKKPFRVSPSYKLVFLCYVFGTSGYTNVRFKDGVAQVDFAVN